MAAGRNVFQQMKTRKVKEGGFIAAVVIPVIVYFGIFFYYPIVTNIYYMFCDYNLLSKPKFVGFKNFARFFSDEIVFTSFKNTFVIALFSVPLVVIFAILIASALFHISKGAGFFRGAIFASYLTSMIVAAIVFKSWFSTESGFINGLLQSMEKSKIPWLSEPATAMMVVIIMSVWKYVGYYVVIFLAGYSNINTDLYEAARVDGANSVRLFFSITIPQLMPTIIYSSIIATITYLRSYSSVVVLTGGGPYSSTKTVIMYMFEQGFTSRKVGYASVIAIALTLVILIFTGIQMKMSNMLSEEETV